MLEQPYYLLAAQESSFLIYPSSIIYHFPPATLRTLRKYVSRSLFQKIDS